MRRRRSRVRLLRSAYENFTAAALLLEHGHSWTEAAWARGMAADCARQIADICARRAAIAAAASAASVVITIVQVAS